MIVLCSADDYQDQALYQTIVELSIKKNAVKGICQSIHSQPPV